MVGPQAAASLREATLDLYSRAADIARQLIGVVLKGEAEDARRMNFYVDSVVRERARTSAHWKDFFSAAQGLWE